MHITDAHGTTYELWQHMGMVGYKVYKNGEVRFIYLNPSSESDDCVSNVFLYHGNTGDPSQDTSVTYVNIYEE